MFHAPNTEDEKDELLRGRVQAERIAAVMSREGCKGRKRYARLLIDQMRGEPAQDEADQYRLDEERLAGVERALRLYEAHHGVQVARGRVYLRDGLACCPDGVESDLVLLMVHVRRTPWTYSEAVERGVDDDERRRALAMMAVSGLRMAVVINYILYRDGGEDWVEAEVEFSAWRAAHIEAAMLEFARKVAAYAREAA